MTARTIGTYLLTLKEATRIIRLFKQKKHRGAGYYFELEDAPERAQIASVRSSKAAMQAAMRHYMGPISKNSPEDFVLLKVLRDTPDK